MSNLIIPNLIGFKEEDNYKEGCLPETSFYVDLGISFEGKNQEELIKKLMDYFGVNKDSILLNSCDEKGRIDIQVLEDENSISITDKDKQKLKLWKEGKIKLWSAIYSGDLYKQNKIKWIT